MLGKSFKYCYIDQMGEHGEGTRLVYITWFVFMPISVSPNSAFRQKRHICRRRLAVLSTEIRVNEAVEVDGRRKGQWLCVLAEVWAWPACEAELRMHGGKMRGPGWELGEQKWEESVDTCVRACVHCDAWGVRGKEHKEGQNGGGRCSGVTEGGSQWWWWFVF